MESQIKTGYKTLFSGDYAKYSQASKVCFKMRDGIPIIALYDGNLDVKGLNINVVTKENLLAEIKSYVYPNKQPVVILTEKKKYIKFTPNVTVSEEEDNNILSKILAYFLTKPITIIECGNMPEMIEMIIKAGKGYENFMLAMGEAKFCKNLKH